MSKKIYSNEVEEPKNENEKSLNGKDKKEFKDDKSELGPGKEKEKSRMAKVHNYVSKGLIPPQNSTDNKGRWNDLKVRIRWSVIMASLFFLILFLGHVYSALMVLLIIICIFYELIEIPKFKERAAGIKDYYLINWYVLCLGLYYTYIQTIKEKINFLLEYPVFYYLLTYHKFICFMLYCFGFLLFLKSLTKEENYRYQFRQFAFSHIIFLIFGYLSSMIISNIFNGLIWFLLPVSCVVVNDISAYFWGRGFGVHKITALSPKKTWEGFIGAFFTTIIWCNYFTKLLSNYEMFLCPVENLTLVPFNLNSLKCDTSELLKKNEFSYEVLGKVFKITLTNLQFHSISIGLFASLIAPLGGLFASGFKRSIKIKDFADTIPGHGGVTDRMDCEMLNGAFVYIYLNQFVFYDGAKIVDNIIKKIMRLTHEQQLIIFEKLKLLLKK